jgi:hypothetical protein
MFSVEASVSPAGESLFLRAMVNETVAFPGEVTLTEGSKVESYTFMFYLPNVVAGTYTVEMERKVSGPTVIGAYWERALAVIALPA